MPTLLRTLGSGLLVLAGLFTLAGLSDDAPGLVVVAMGVVGVALYALLGARREDARRDRLEELLRAIADRLPPR